MPRLNPCTPKEAIKKLKRGGFIETHQRGSHLYFENAEGKITSVSIHDGRNIPIGTLHKIVTALRQQNVGGLDFLTRGSILTLTVKRARRGRAIFLPSFKPNKLTS